ncbi:MAG: sigma 54-interacting transcriptional regulator [Candidatus Zixiibacteriota bacterium]
MSQIFANPKVAMLIDLRQLIDDGQFQKVVDRIADLETDEHISSGSADKEHFLSLKGLALFRLSKFEDALSIVREALTCVKGSSDNQLIAELQSTACRCLVELGRANEAEREYRDLIATYRRLDDTVGVIRSLNRLSRIQFIKGHFGKAIDYLLEAIDHARIINDVKWQAMITGNLGTILNLSGEFHKAIEYLDESISLNRVLENRPNLGRACLSKAYALMHIRNFVEAKSALTAAEEILGSLDSIADRISLLQYKAQLAHLECKHESAIEFAASALAMTDSNGSFCGEAAQIGRLLAEAHLSLGHDAEARSFATAGLEAAERSGERVEIAACRRVLATVAVHEGDSRMTDAEFAAIVRSLDEIGARYELAVSYQNWSQVAMKPAHIREHRIEAERIRRSLRLDWGDIEIARGAKSGDAAKTQLIGSSPCFLEVLSQIDAIADSEIPILLLGQTGVGKDQIARYIHSRSSRRNVEIVSVDCGTIQPELAESHLFGHERGAFTDANETKVGLLETAAGGTLFLNEVGELPLGIQVKLLSALENKSFYRVGGTTPRKVDFRIIAATNVDLHSAVREKKFRADLFYRLAVMTLQVPSLSERGDDVIELFEHFMRIEQVPLREVDRHTLDVLKARLREFDWSGNVRELQSLVFLCRVMEKREPRAVCMRMIERLTSPIRDITSFSPDSSAPLTEAVEALERSKINAALDTCGGIIRRAAAKLGLPEATLRSKMKKYRINAA